MKSSHKIILFQRIIPTYRVPMFRYLYEKLNIIVCHSKERKNGKIKAISEPLDFPNEPISRVYYQKEETSVLQNVIAPIIKHKPKIVISQFSVKYLTFWLILLLKPIFRYKLIVWTHGIKSDQKIQPFIRFRGKLCLWVYKHVDAIILYSSSIKKRMNEYLPNQINIFVAQNTLDTNTFKKHLIQFENIGLEEIKKQLGFNTKYNLIFIGRLLPTKRIDLLLESFDILSKNLDISLHIIGDGEEKSQILKHQSQNKNIHYYGSIYDDELAGKYLYASDLFVMPGYIGLSIVHAFSFGTPIITCKAGINGPFHAPEIEYLSNGCNGEFCELSHYDIAEKIERLLLDNNKLISMKNCAIETAYNICSVENFIDGFTQAIKMQLNDQ